MCGVDERDEGGDSGLRGGGVPCTLHEATERGEHSDKIAGSSSGYFSGQLRQSCCTAAGVCEKKTGPPIPTEALALSVVMIRPAGSCTSSPLSSCRTVGTNDFLETRRGEIGGRGEYESPTGTAFNGNGVKLVFTGLVGTIIVSSEVT